MPEWALASIFSGGMLGLFLLGYISKKAKKTRCCYRRDNRCYSDKLDESFTGLL
jgi:hypothetical protein